MQMILTALFYTSCSGILKVSSIIMHRLITDSVCHPILALNSFIRVLDERWISRTPQSGNVAKKTRRNGAPSLSSPPPSAPEWAVCRSAETTLTGIFIMIFIVPFHTLYMCLL